MPVATAPPVLASPDPGADPRAGDAGETPAPQRERLRARYDISAHGRFYTGPGCHYTRLEDAVAYARVVGADASRTERAAARALRPPVHILAWTVTFHPCARALS